MGAAFALDEVAHIDAAIGDAAGDGCAHVREFEVELRCPHRCLGRRYGTVRSALGLDVIVQRRLRYRLALDERTRPFEGLLGELRLGLRLDERCLRLGQCYLERPFVDREENLPLRDELAIGEMDLVEITGDTRADLDGLGRLKTAGELVPLDKFLDEWLGHRHRRRSLCRALAFVTFPARRERHQQGACEPDAN